MTPKIAGAQDASVALRGGTHETYGRLVFDWSGPSAYTLTRSQPDNVVIEFKRDGAPDAKALQSLKVPNIKALSVQSQNPLRVALSIPADSEIRDMTIGERVIIDVYNPPGGQDATPTKIAASVAKEAPAAPEAQKPAPAERPESEAPKEENLAAAQSPAAGEVPETDAQKEIAAKEDAKAPLKDAPESSEANADAAAPGPSAPSDAALAPAGTPEPEAVQLRPSAIPTVILMSSTQSMGAAAFRLGDKLYVANDKADLLIQPQISGPEADAYKPIMPLKPDLGQVFEVNLPAGNIVKGQGGGLVWRLRISPDLDPAEPVQPVRMGIVRDEVRSGKLVWPFANARTVMSLENPQGGLPLKIVTVEKSEQAAILPRSFVDFDVLPSPIGLAIMPKVEDLDVRVTSAGVEISRPQGLSLSEQGLIDDAQATPVNVEQSGSSQRLFDFENWQLGTAAAVDDNRMILLESLKDLSEGGRSENLVSLAKMFVSHGMGPEAMGALRFAQHEMPSLRDSPEYVALRGVAEVLAHQNEYGFEDLSGEALKPFEETAYWRTVALAGIGDWQQAEQALPRRVGFVANYPEEVQNRIVPVLAETALRAGDVNLGGAFLALMQDDKNLNEGQKAAVQYLKGEAERQKDNIAETKKLWEPLTVGPDDLYRAKAGLALTRLLVDEGELSPGKAIDRLERLRYAWRGDDLEAQINMWLGRTYFESGDYIKGLQIMREATTFVPGTQLAQRIAGEMSDAFTNLYISDALDKVSPLDAVALYNEFIELVPIDERGDQVIERLAEHLVKANLLSRAGDLLDYLLAHRLKGEHAYRVATRLAAIRLLDKEPQKAQAALDLAQKIFEALPDEMKTPSRTQAVSLLRARTLSQLGRPDQALELLRDMPLSPDVNRLRAEIAWTASYWDDAAEALDDVIMDKDISLTRPLDEENTALLLRRAIALNLSSDRIALANMREKYTDAMNQTDKGKIFEVITRPRKSAGLADRDTLMGIVSETDLFSDFLNSYKSMQSPVN